MILADSSVWVDFLRGKENLLQPLLALNRVAIHPLVIGEIALGSLRNRQRIIDNLRVLNTVNIASDGEVMALIQQAQLFGIGVGWVDVHLVASCLLTPGTTLLTPGTTLLTLDRRLDVACRRLSISATSE